VFNPLRRRRAVHVSDRITTTGQAVRLRQRSTTDVAIYRNPSRFLPCATQSSRLLQAFRLPVVEPPLHGGQTLSPAGISACAPPLSGPHRGGVRLGKPDHKEPQQAGAAEELARKSKSSVVVSVLV
jgi:hypothetical protein